MRTEEEKPYVIFLMIKPCICESICEAYLEEVIFKDIFKKCFELKILVYSFY